MEIMLQDDESGLNYDKCKYIFTNSSDNIGTKENLYTDGNLRQKNTTIEMAKGEGEWYLHILATDNAGNSIEQVSTDKVIIEGVADYDYVEKEQTAKLLPGNYKFECWGARGGSNHTESKNFGAYTLGDIELDKNTTFYIYVGEQGDTNRKIKYNGGAIGGKTNDTQSGIEGCSGGGATDIRTIGGTWDSFETLKSRIMVAAGGGGAAQHSVYESAGQYSIAGGLIGYTGGYYSGHAHVGQEGGGATQTSGGIAGNNHFGASGTVNAGKFGIGGSCESTSDQGAAGGGGGGYYGGGAGGSTLSLGYGQGRRRWFIFYIRT